jgi:arsenite methyltransferase
MKPLYLSTPVRKGLGPCLRPGGTVLTERIVELLSPDSADLILDAGCGMGTSMEMVRSCGGYRVFGIDLDDGLLRQAHGEGRVVARGELAALPFADATFDTVLCECVWNLTDKEKVLAEFARVLKSGGILAMTDIYSRNGNSTHAETWPVPCCFSGATDLDKIEDQVVNAGFRLRMLEDHTRLLNKTAAEFIFTHGSLKDFWQSVTGSAELAARACRAAALAKPGFFLLMAQRSML